MSEIISIAMEWVSETDDAWLLNDGDNDVWLPKSLVEVDMSKGALCEVRVPEWLAQKKGLI